MPVDPFLLPLLATLPGFPDVVDDWDARRSRNLRDADALAGELLEPGPVVADVRTVPLPVQGGQIDLRVYRPATPGPHAAHLYLHGGGWVEGSVHDAFVDTLARERCVGADCVVVTVDYRKAPEHPYPTGLDDCDAALGWIVDHADDLGVRRDQISVGGASAGANLAAALTLRVRDEGGPSLWLQVLEIPVLDLTLTAPSVEELGTGYGLTADGLRHMVRLYLGDDGRTDDPCASPLLAPDLSALPPAYITAAEYDPLRDDAEVYARRLADAGVPVSYHCAPGHIHGSMAFTRPMASARAYREALLARLRAHGD